MNIDPKDLDALFESAGISQVFKPAVVTLLTMIETARATEKAKHDEHIEALKSATVELELIRTALQDVAKAIYNYTHENFHTVR